MLTPDRQELLAADPPLGPGTVLRGRFLLQEPLEHGRFGTMYKAVDRQSVGWDGSAGYVSVLILPSEISGNPRSLAAVRENVARLRSLTHESIVGVYDFDADGDLHFLVLEYVDGESLRTVLDNLRPELLWQEEALEVVRAVGAALDFAHQRGIVHGDVRPENVIVRGARDVKLLFASTCLLRNVAPFATEPKDDVFGLACLAYELLAGMPPFAGSGSAAVRAAREPRRIKKLPRRQWDALRAALAPHERRTRSVARFMADMRFAPPRVREAKRDAKRRRRGTGAAPFAFLTLLASVAAVGYLNRDTLRALLAPGAPSERLVPATLPGTPQPGDPAAAGPASGEAAGAAPSPADVAEAPAAAVEAAPAAGDAAPASVDGERPDSAAADAPAPSAERDLPGTPAGAGAARTPPAAVSAPGGGAAAAATEPAAAPTEAAAGATEPPATAAPPRAAAEPLPGATERPASATTEPPAPVTAESPVPGTAAPPQGADGSAASVPAERLATGEPPPAVPERSEPGARTGVAAATGAAPAAESRPARPAPPPAFGFAVPEIVVSERGTVAVVDIVRLAGDGAASVAWWTSDGSAVGGEDYADFGAVIESFAPGERRRTIRIPITADGTPEEREWFSVSLNDAPDGNGRRAAEVKRMTITIVDDD
ncbi:MAG TPA: protein kinase [Gammaproteobacteria bacterium]